MRIAYKTNNGVFYNGTVEKVLSSKKMERYKGKVDLIFTSPPFPLNRKKKYGNLQGQEYLNWLNEIGGLLYDFLSPSGSLVIEIGNSWEPGSPTMSVLPLKSLLTFLESNNYYLCQQFVWNNPAKLPSPAQWVNVERIRVKDSFTNIWWMSKSPRPSCDNRKVLGEYSKSMKSLLKRKKFNSGKRPSEHDISVEGFLKNNGGAIPSNVITAANTVSSSPYQSYCKKNGFVLHPARMPMAIPEFFIKFLTDENDLVLDPFGGSNTTGFVSETLNRKWLSVEVNSEYILGSRGRFGKNVQETKWLKQELLDGTVI